MQENSNEDELAGLTKWLPDPCEPGVRCGASAGTDAGARRRNGDRCGDLQRGGHASCRSAQACAWKAKAGWTPTPSRMQNPDRLVLDFAGTRLAVQKTVIPGVSAPVRGVRLGQYRPDVARVVIDLTAAAPYQIGRDGNALVIFFDAPAGVSDRATT